MRPEWQPEPLPLEEEKTALLELPAVLCQPLLPVRVFVHLVPVFHVVTGTAEQWVAAQQPEGVPVVVGADRRHPGDRRGTRPQRQ